MKPWKRQEARKKNTDDRRLVALAIVVFLLIASLAARLFFIQVWQHKKYILSAADQHDYYAKLEPNRGKIFIQDLGTQLYPLATNKDYVVIYAIPQAVEQADLIGQKLYDFFKAEAVAKEVDEALKKQEAERLSKTLSEAEAVPAEERGAKIAQLKADHEAFLADPIYQEAKAKRRQEMIDASRQAILDNYQKIFNKKDDPYEPLEKKIDPDLAKNFHVALLKDLGQTVEAGNLEVKDGQMIDQKNSKAVAVPGLGYASENYRYYLESGVAAHALGFVSYDQRELNKQVGKHGSYGLEGFFDEELFGSSGSIKAERGAGGLVLLNDRQYVNKTDGLDLVLTLERPVQFFVDKALRAGAEKYKAAGGTVIVIKPETGAIVAMSSWPDFDPNKYNEVKDNSVFNNPAIFDQYEPGSVFKAITMASALQEGKVTPETTYEDKGQLMIEGWPKPIKNSDYDTAGGHGRTNMIQVLEKSLNTGSVFAMSSIGAETFADYVKKFGFGEKTGIELEGEAQGDISSITAKKVKPISAATASFGQGISVTPLQMVMGFGALANQGKLMKPYLVKEIRRGDEVVTKSEPRVLQEVISRQTAETISAMLVKVVQNGHAKGAQVPGYFLAGKTGTAQVATKGGYGNKYNHTFVGYGPVEKSAFVILVRLYDPRGYEYAESTAVPLAHDIIEFMLNYWQIPKNQ